MASATCPKCRSELPLAVANTGRPFPCGGCGQSVYLDVFPAAQRSVASVAEGQVAEGAASCFFHDDRPARVACDGCGRFLCSLCDVPVGKSHLCPECLEVRNREGKKQTLPNERVPWDRVALALAILSIPFWFITIATAPVVLYLVVRYWNAPGSLVGRAWPRFVIAGLVASLQIVGWITFIYQAFWGALRHA